MGEPAPGLPLRRVRALCDKYGAVLVFDETDHGLPLVRHGAQSIYGVTPDLLLGHGHRERLSFPRWPAVAASWNWVG